MDALYNPASIDIAVRKLSVEQVIELITKGDLKLEEYYKSYRREIWDSIQRTQFTESLLLGIPFGNIWLKEHIDGTYCVLDGMKRLNVCADLYSVGYGDPLRPKMHMDMEGLSVLVNLAEMDVSELPRPLQRKLGDVIITCNIVRSGTPVNAVRDIYERIKCIGRYSCQ